MFFFLNQAKDADIEKNGQISYFLPADENFVINSQTGELKSKAPLDYEKDRVNEIINLQVTLS